MWQETNGNSRIVNLRPLDRLCRIFTRPGSTFIFYLNAIAWHRLMFRQPKLSFAFECSLCRMRNVFGIIAMSGVYWNWKKRKWAILIESFVGRRKLNLQNRHIRTFKSIWCIISCQRILCVLRNWLKTKFALLSWDEKDMVANKK